MRFQAGDMPLHFGDLADLGVDDAVGEFAVALALGAVGHEAHVPAVDAVQIGVATLGERAEQIEGKSNKECRTPRLPYLDTEGA